MVEAGFSESQSDLRQEHETCERLSAARSADVGCRLSAINGGNHECSLSLNDAVVVPDARHTGPCRGTVRELVSYQAGLTEKPMPDPTYEPGPVPTQLCAEDAVYLFFQLAALAQVQLSGL